MLKISNGLEVQKKPGCGTCNDPQAQEITDALLAGIGFDDVEKLCDGRLKTSSLGRHKKHVKKSLEDIPKVVPTESAEYPLSNPSLTSEGVRLIALEEMIRTAQRLRDHCLSSTTVNPKAEEAYLRALSQIEAVSAKLKFR